MGLFGIFSQKKEIREISEEERQQREHTRKLNALKRQLDMERLILEAQVQKAELEQELDELTGADEEDDDGIDSIFANFIKQAMPQQAKPIEVPAAEANGEVNLSDEQIKKYWQDMNFVQRAFAKRQSDEQIKEFLIQKEPRLSQDSLNRAVSVVRAN
jgi:predicted Holliday junction resolvase-like endonuclease